MRVFLSCQDPERESGGRVLGSSSCGCCCCGNSEKELFKNLAEILLEAPAAGNLISERPSKGEGGGGEKTP